MDFGSFLASVEARIKEHIKAPEPSFSKTHVFNLGEDEKVEEGIQDIWDDLKDEMKAGVPMPFNDISCVSLVPNVRNPHNSAELIKAKPSWIFDRVVQVPFLSADRIGLRNLVLPDHATPEMREAAARDPVQKLAVMRIEEDMQYVLSWICYFYGVIDGGMMLTAVPSQQMVQFLGEGAADPKLISFCMEESRPVLKQMTAISHPANYIVKVKPKLTTKEERRVSSGKTFPTQKMPHFVVVDHDILVRMSGRNAAGSPHASPVPHHRRGHWMRLGERCREARAAGKEKVWIRPTYVGDTKFSDLKNDYSVLMEFGNKKELAPV